MNTRKQVLIMSALLMMMLVVVAVYAAWYPSRATDAEAEFEEKRAERGSIIFARNCRLCHGDVGEGGQLGGRLAAAPALNRPDLQGFVDAEATITAEASRAATSITVSNSGRMPPSTVILIDEERMKVTGVSGNTVDVERGYGHTEAAAHFSGARILVFNDAEEEEQIDLITNTISCGRVGTAMQPWAQEHGGPLSQEQIDQLMVLITTARWDLVEKEVDKEDLIDVRLLEPVSADTSNLRLSNVTRFTEDDVIRIGEERIRVTGVPNVPESDPDKSGLIQVERGILNTFPLEHSADERLYSFPRATEPSILMSSCGQTARPAAAGGPCEEENGVVQIAADNTAFDCDRITVSAGGQTRVAFENQETVPHNIAFYRSESDLTPVASGSATPVFPGPNQTQELTFGTPDAGQYFFRCDVHPVQMTGTYIVQ
jgi:plastocyanin/mono/diheme cytochrome c family protein